MVPVNPRAGVTVRVLATELPCVTVMEDVAAATVGAGAGAIATTIGADVEAAYCALPK
jgi:hypothetical protein